MLLAVASGSAMAEWVKISSSKDGQMTVYANPPSIRKNADIVKMWVLYDYKSLKRSGFDWYLSAKLREEYDCNNDQLRIVDFSWHDRNMGDGRVVYSDTNTLSWEPVAPDSLDEVKWKYACGKN